MQEVQDSFFLLYVDELHSFAIYLNAFLLKLKKLCISLLLSVNCPET